MPAFQARVLSNRRITPTTRAVFIDSGDRVLDFKPGQWARLGVDAASAKPYSIASTPAEVRGGALQFLIREEGWGLEISRLARGSAVHVDGPHGRFGLPDHLAEPHALFVAGGTGIAPIRAMLLHVLAMAKRPACTLVYSARSTDEFAYGKEFRDAARAGSIRLTMTVTRAAHSRWKGGATRVDRVLLETVLESPDTQAFVCGPDSFVSHVGDLLGELGVKKVRAEGM